MLETTQSFYDNSVYKYRTTTYDLDINVFDNSAKSDISNVSALLNRFLVASQLSDEKGSVTSYATGELGGFFLDGRTELMPDTLTTEQIGWWSPMGDANGDFILPPAVKIWFTNTHSSAGITCQYDFYSYPLKTRCTWYSDGGLTVLDTQELESDSPLQVFDKKVDGYDRIDIEILKVKPYCYSKMATIDYGLAIRLSPMELQGATLTEKTSIMSNTISPNELEFNIINYDYKYNVFDTTSMFKYFKFGQEVNVRAAVMDQRTEVYEYIPMGKFFIGNVSVENGILKVKSYGILNILNKETFYSPWYESETVSNIIADILGGYSYYVHPNVADVELTGFIPTQSKKEALKVVAVACNAVVKENRDGSIWIYKATEEFSNNQIITQATQYHSYGMAGTRAAGEPLFLVAGETPIYQVESIPNVFTVFRDQRISQIKTSLIGTYQKCEVTWLAYGKKDTETINVDFVTDANGDAVISHEPMEVSASSETMTHYVDVSLFHGTPNTSYSATITGKKYYADTNIVTAVDNTGISNDDEKLVMELKDNKLIASTDVGKACAEWYLSQLKKRKDITFTWWAVATVEAPDYIKLETSDGTIATMQINEIKYNLYTLTAEVKGVI